MRPSQDNDEVFAIHISFHLVSDCNQRDWQPMLGRDTFFRFYRKPSSQDIACLDIARLDWAQWFEQSSRVALGFADLVLRMTGSVS